MIVVTNPEKVTTFTRGSGSVSAGQDMVLDLLLAAARRQRLRKPGLPSPRKRF